MEAHLKTFWRVNATLRLQFRIAHQTASSDQSYPSGSRQDPKEAEGRKEKRRREMIFNSRRAMASPILKDRVLLTLNLKTGYRRRIIKLFFRITPNSNHNLAFHRDRMAR